MSGQIIGLHEWFQTPPGRYLLAWEQSRFDQAVADVFGYHALQLGVAEVDGLRTNRMPHRWLALDDPAAAARSAALFTDFTALPFSANSLDLVVLPHALELSHDPHGTLREVERVLVPEGRVIVFGFNPASLWGARQWAGRWALRFGADRDGRALYLPRAGDFIGPRRLRDWLRLLGFEVDGGSFGCYRPPLRSQSWLDRWVWMEKAGDRWWPVFGAVYTIAAVKRVRGMRLIGPAWKKAPKPRAAPAVVSHRHRETHEVQ
jgi:SAM-dependent methyltransferase